MKVLRFLGVVALISVLCGRSSAEELKAAEAAGYEVVFDEGSRLSFEGDSTFHGYEIVADKITLESDVEDLGLELMKDASVRVLTCAGNAPKLRSMVMTVPVESLSSHIPGLAGTMYKALKYKEFPEIVFTLSDYAAAKAEGSDATNELKVAGTLGVAGTTNTMNLVMISTAGDGFVSVKGETDMLMTEFGIKPPTAMMGTIKAADKITVKWDLVIKVKPRERSESAEVSVGE